MAILLPNKKIWTRQPQGAIEPDWAHPFFDSSYAFVYVKNVFYDTAGAVFNTAAIRQSSSLSGQSFGGSVRSGIAAVRAADSSAICSVISAGGNNGYHCVPTSSGSGNYYGTYLANGQAQQGGGAGGAGGRRTLFWTAPAGAYASAVAFDGFTNNANWSVYQDGLIPGGKSSSGTAGSYSYGNGLAYTYGWNVASVANGLTHREMLAKTAAEIDSFMLRDLSLNPWQIFKKRKSYFFASITGSAGDLAANAQAAATGAGTITSTLNMSSGAIAAATASGIVNQSIDISGSSASIAVGGGTATISMTLSGDAFNQLFADGLLNQIQALSGSASGQSSGQGNLDAGGGLEGAANASAIGGGTINLTATLSGAAILQALASANLDGGNQSDLSGNANATASGAALINLATALLANAGITATGSGALGSSVPISGLAPITVTGSGGMTTTQALSGAAVTVLNGSGDITVGFGGLSSSAIIQSLAGGSLGMQLSMSAAALMRTVAQAVLSVTGDEVLPLGMYSLQNLTPRYLLKSATPVYQMRSTRAD